MGHNKKKKPKKKWSRRVLCSCMFILAMSQLLVLNFFLKNYYYIFVCMYWSKYLLGFRRKESKDNTLLDSERRVPAFWAFKFGRRHENLWEE